jgi:hypothetical protein
MTRKFLWKLGGYASGFALAGYLYGLLIVDRVSLYITKCLK